MSQLKFLADENLEKDLVKTLEAKGFDIRFAEKGLKNCELIKIANEEGRILLTHDHDFLKVEVYKPDKAVIVLPIAHIEVMQKMLLEFLRSISLEELKGKVFLLGKEGRFEFWS